MSRRHGYVFLVVLLFTCVVAAQTFRGSINGTVNDNTGAAVAGAEVKVVSDETGLSRTVLTSDDGNYTAAELPPGSYSVTVTKSGFRMATAKGVPVSVSAPARANITLSPGQVQEADTCRERCVCAQVSLIRLEPVVEKCLADGDQYPSIRRAHAGGDFLVGSCPLPHGPFQRPVACVHQSRHHLRESFTGRCVGWRVEVPPLLVARCTPGVHEGDAIAREVGEMPVEAALGHSETTAQPVDLERFDAFLGKNRVARPDPVVHRQTVGAGLCHMRQPTTLRRPLH